MLRTVANRNEWIFRRSLNKFSRSALRVLTTRTLRNRSTSSSQKHVLTTIFSCQPMGVCGTNFVRAYSSYPDHIKVPLPALSPTMETGSIVSWEKKEGDKVNEGDLLAEIETDKATMGFETPEEGYLAKIIVPAGTKDVPIGKLVCILVQDQGNVAAFKNFVDDSPPIARAAKPAAMPPASAMPLAPVVEPSVPPTVVEPSAPPSPKTAARAAKPITAVEQRGPRVYASPMAKKLAEAQQLRLEGAGSGIYGSIKSSDLADKKPAEAKPSKDKEQVAPQGGYIDIPISNVRGVIAKRLVESKTTIPHYYVTMECQMDALLKLRAKINKKYEKEKVKVSVNDFIIKATAIACRKVPEANSYWMGSVIRQFDNVDVSIAVSTDFGLITPIVFAADRKGVVEISKEVKELADKARKNKLKPHEFQGGTVCVSNMGMYGVTQFAAVINPPQSCILAVGATNKKLVVNADSEKGFKEVSTMYVTLSADHRIVDGAIAAKWLQYFRDFMEDPSTMIV
uniref:dihydrolipoyllysine-residue acetyltransferase n=1 Tax=Glossina palpalis gambiensis TaxID=67801 RepID=A0A1B0AZA2_9MUSC